MSAARAAARGRTPPPRRRPLRRRDALHTHSLRFGPNMTPMVDVVMVILIFFMAATTFAGDEFFLSAGLVRQTPASTQPRADDPFALPPVRLTIALSAADGRTMATGIGLERATPAELAAALAAFTEGTATDRIVLIISAEPNVPYADVVQMHDAATRLGIEKVALQAE